MKPLISLVVPVYNVENFLPKCMESVLSQTYEDYEVILVDDGSTDNSGKICDVYSARDSRVKVFHKSNGGLSDARNYGVQQAEADYVSFIDSDDYITYDYLDYLFTLLSKYDADMACASDMTIYGNMIPNVKMTLFHEEVLSTEEALEKICYKSVSADVRLYKKELLVRHPYPKGRLYEDLATTYKIIGECKTIVFSNKIIYFWVQRTDSIMHSVFSDKQLDVFWAADMQLQFITNKYPRVITAAKARYVMAGASILDILFAHTISNRKKVFTQIREFMKPYIWTVIIKSKATYRIKIACLAVWLGYLPSCFFWSTKRRIKSLVGKTTI